MASAPARVVQLTPAMFRDIMANAPLTYLAPLNAAMAQYGISSPKRVAAFLSQLAVESMELRHTHELWTARRNFHLPGVARKAHTARTKKEYFEHWYGKRADLGNTTVEDGFTYRGRGAIQITGKANYEKIGKGIGQPLKDHPELLEKDGRVDMQASAYFFARIKGLNAVADEVDTRRSQSIVNTNAKLTRSVNGGHNAQHERLKYYEVALKCLGA